MQRYEYKVVPAPQKGTKAKGVKTPEGRFAASIEQLLNQMGQEGWEYQRAELLPSEERAGLTGSTTNWRNVLVFRRAAGDEAIPETETPEADTSPTARAVPGPQDVLATPPAAPAPISEKPQDPPLSLKPSDGVTDGNADDPSDPTR
ncbi:hypothetical protein RA27_01100 [Ruegeria sp. ANG-R]|uniref:DUF4177 domain-containing protein n=1 Tax=Ruegeria sp. ANG-R TaxID=1577903 RepID=UPI00057F03FF|nr:DUF4177 domain-containing protein [Ruegeria sp. ANG-R]KIC42035.1 hypothetical protein RA27_01100 [Ruegeria sp. ANG-R]